ncbi:hypothetical protein M8494_03700 [Serratia ureilytica]
MNSEKAGMMEKVAGKAQEMAATSPETHVCRPKAPRAMQRRCKKIRRRPELRRQHDEETPAALALIAGAGLLTGLPLRRR